MDVDENVAPDDATVQPENKVTVDRAQIATFVSAMFPYADTNTIISLRTFLELEAGPTAVIADVKLNGSLSPLIDEAVKRAQQAATLCAFRGNVISESGGT